jgi:hypothetical protein
MGRAAIGLTAFGRRTAGAFAARGCAEIGFQSRSDEPPGIIPTALLFEVMDNGANEPEGGFQPFGKSINVPENALMLLNGLAAILNCKSTARI